MGESPSRRWGIAGKGFVNCGVMIRDGKVAQFSDLLLFREAREARGLGHCRSVGKQVVRSFLVTLPGARSG